MTLLEMAGAGALTVGAAVVSLELVEARLTPVDRAAGATRPQGDLADHGGLVATAWGAVLTLAALVYLAVNFLGAGIAPTLRHGLCVALLAFWALCYSRFTWRRWQARRERSWPLPPLSFRLRRGVRATARIFLATAPVLLVLAESHSSSWEWNDSLAVALTLLGWGLVARASRPGLQPRNQVVTGFVLAYGALYALTLQTGSGFLTFFALVIVARHCGRTLTPVDTSAAEPARAPQPRDETAALEHRAPELSR